MAPGHGFLTALSRTAGTVGACLLLAACIVLPLPQGDGVVSEGREVAATSMGAIVPGRTSRNDAIAMLGDPEAVWEEQRVLVYAWDRVNMKLLWVVAGGMRAAGGIVDVPTHHLLLVQFDAHDVVTRMEWCTRPLHEGFGTFLRGWADGRSCR